MEHVNSIDTKERSLERTFMEFDHAMDRLAHKVSDTSDSVQDLAMLKQVPIDFWARIKGRPAPYIALATVLVGSLFLITRIGRRFRTRRTLRAKLAGEEVILLV